MPSPFPGMDPYLEPSLGDAVHVVNELARGMDASEPVAARRPCEARAGGIRSASERYLAAGEQSCGGTRPDVTAVDLGAAPPVPADTGAARAGSRSGRAGPQSPYARGPVIVSPRADRRSSTPRGAVASSRSVEVLSPWNNVERAVRTDAYRRKLRRPATSGGDQLGRGRPAPQSRGRWLPVRWDALRPAPPGRLTSSLTYRVAADDLARAVPGLDSAERLPVVGDPPPGPRAGRPARPPGGVRPGRTPTGPFKRVDYTRPPDPPLAETDAAWAADLLRQPR